MAAEHRGVDRSDQDRHGTRRPLPTRPDAGLQLATLSHNPAGSSPAHLVAAGPLSVEVGRLWWVAAHDCGMTGAAQAGRCTAFVARGAARTRA